VVCVYLRLLRRLLGSSRTAAYGSREKKVVVSRVPDLPRRFPLFSEKI
jgi:hypothetical protein